MSSRLPTLESWVQESPDDAFSRYALAMEYKKLKRFEDALEQFQQLTQRNPDYCATYYHYGLLLAQSERVEEARKVLQKGMEEAKKAGEDHTHKELVEAFEAIADS